MRPVIPSADCPYNYLEPVTNPAMFFGREEQLKSLQEGVSGQIRSSFLVVGGPRMGKTSLLLELKRRLNCELNRSPLGFIPVYLDMASTLPQPTSLWPLIRRVREAISADMVAGPSAAGLSSELTALADTGQTLLEELVSLLWQKNRRVILLLDNADTAFTRAGWEGLWPYLHSLYESSLGQAVAYVITARSRSELRRGSDSLAFLNLLYTVELHDLSEKETSMLAGTFAENRLPHDVIQELYLQSGGHPFLVQYLMACLWKQHLQQVTPCDIKSFAREFMEGRDDFIVWCDALGEVGREVYHLVACEGSISYSEILHRMVRIDGSSSGHGWDRVVAVRDSVQQLRTMGMVRQTPVDIYSLSCKMFYDFFSLHGPQINSMRFTGGTLMTIEQDALQVAEFLRSLREQIIAHPEFGRIYGEVGRVDQEVTRLATALQTNYERLQEARRNLALYPGRRQYQDDVDTHLQGLSTTTLEIEKLWRQFRADALTGTESLIIQVEQKAPKQSAFDNVLAGLGKFKDFLIVALDIRKAVVEWSPVLVDAVRRALDQLGKISLPW